MQDAGKPYQTGRSVCAWVELFGAIIIALGLLGVVAGFIVGEIPGIIDRRFDQEYYGIFFLRIMSTIPGFTLVWTGLMTVMLAQHAKTAMDTADMTREMLALARHSAGDDGGAEGQSERAAAASPGATGRPDQDL